MDCKPGADELRWQVLGLILLLMLLLLSVYFGYVGTGFIIHPILIAQLLLPPDREIPSLDH